MDTALSASPRVRRTDLVLAGGSLDVEVGPQVVKDALEARHQRLICRAGCHLSVVHHYLYLFSSW